MSLEQQKQRLMIVPGNGCTPVKKSNWYSWLAKKSEESGMFSGVILEDMPDPYVAREKVWIPFIHEKLKEPAGGATDNCIIIGHSSGAVAAMRFLERYRLLGCILVSACHTDLGDSNERASGYYDRSWEWETIKANAQWILQYHSSDDPFISVAESDHVAASLSTEYTLFTDKSHFFSDSDVSHIIPAIQHYLS